MSDAMGRRPDGPGAYHYEDDSNLMDCLVHYNQEGTRLQALWVGNDLFLPGYPTDKWRFIDDMPGDFVPLHPPVAAAEPDWSKAPKWAKTAHLVLVCGYRNVDLEWYWSSSDGTDEGEENATWDGSRQRFKLTDLFDFRKILSRRPEVSGE